MSSLLPPNATILERAFDALVAERLAAIETSYRDFWSAALCPIDQLPWLAWSVSIDEWDPSWSEDVRRSQVARAISLQRRKGTVSAVKSSIAGFGGTAALREWWETTPQGDPHTFDLVVSLSGSSAPSTEYVDAVLRSIAAAKPLRSHFTFTLAQNLVGGVGLRAAVRPAVFVRLSAIAPAALPSMPSNALTLDSQALTLGGDYLTIGA